MRFADGRALQKDLRAFLLMNSSPAVHHRIGNRLSCQPEGVFLCHAGAAHHPVCPAVQTVKNRLELERRAGAFHAGQHQPRLRSTVNLNLLAIIHQQVPSCGRG
jgi:hypothetical protein